MAKPLTLILIILFFYLFSLLQTSFIPYFTIGGIVINFILILVVLMNIFQKPVNPSGLYAALIGGFFSDIFSGWPIGLWMLILLLIAILIKQIIKNYVRVPSAVRA